MERIELCFECGTTLEGGALEVRVKGREVAAYCNVCCSSVLIRRRHGVVVRGVV